MLAAAGGAGALLVVALPSLAVATAAALGILALVRRRPRLAVVAAAAFALCASRATTVLARDGERRAQLLPEVGPGRDWPASCEVDDAEIVASPALRASSVQLEVVAPTLRCQVDARTRTYRDVRIRLATGDASDASALGAARGDRVHASARLAPVQTFLDPDVGDPRPRGALRGVALSGTIASLHVVPGHAPVSWLDAVRAHVRMRIRASFPGEAEAMARALVLGEDDVEPDDRVAFQRSGLSHLLAVSGMHLVLVVAGAVGALRAVLVRIGWVAVRVDPARAAAVAGVPLAFLYADLSGGSGSAMRAAWMMAAALTARALARPPSPARALGLSSMAMIAASPLAVFDLSFLLSVAATTGLLVFSEPCTALCGPAFRERLPRLTQALATTGAATIACAPLLALLGPDVSLVAVLANVVAVPLGEAMALPLCLVHTVLAKVPLVERGTAVAAAGALFGVRAVARIAADLPWNALPVPRPTPGMLVALAFAASLRALGVAGRARVLLAALLATLVVLEVARRLDAAPRGELRVTFLDVGQGDAALVDLPDGTAMLVDAGGLVGSPLDVGERVVAPTLRARARASLRAVVVSHPHPDHFGGLAAGLARTRVDEVWDTGQAAVEGRPSAYLAALDVFRRRGSVVRGAQALCGAHDVGGAQIEVLAPCPGPDTDHGPNDNSFVLRIRHGRRAFLLVGDAEHGLEEQLLARAARGEIALAADVLKVGHHGSRTSSTPAFVAAVAPRWAVISSGVRNRFGHPHAETLGTLARAGTSVLRTDRDGAVTFRTDGEALDVETSR